MSTVYVIQVILLVAGAALTGYVFGTWRHGGKFPAGLSALASMLFAASIVIGALA